ncbi:MAG: UDP-N-acetylmuramate--L-alanine ligase [Myxococcota bacterium]
MVEVPLSERSETEAEARRGPPPVDWRTVGRVHLMGICGSAMGAFAGMLRRQGFEVRGSDRGAYPPMSTLLRDMGVQVMEGYRPEHLDWGPDVVVVGNVVRPFYAEAVAMRRRGIPHASLPQALAALCIGDRHSVVITGTHGKTTTSSMVAWLLHEAGLDPGFLIGGVTGNFDANHRLGGGPVFVVEGDEYDTAYFDKGPKFLHYRPRTASINNVEFDHADIYPDVEAIESEFRRFAALLPEDGHLLVPVDDARARRVAEASVATIWTFGRSEEADVRASDVRADASGTHLLLHLPGAAPRETRLALWGDHNLANALTAAGLACAAGASPEAVADALPHFRLPRKRQEVRGEADGVPVVDDFAHHPTAIRETLRAVRMRYPGRRVLALFEVESNTSRRRVFQEAFAEALSQADRVWFCEPLAKDDGLPPAERLDMDALIGSIRAGGTPARLLVDVDDLADEAAAEARPDRDVIVAMSGRDFHGVHGRILDRLEAREAR